MEENHQQNKISVLEKEALRKNVINYILSDLKSRSSEGIPTLITLGLIGMGVGGIIASQEGDAINQLYGILKGISLTAGPYVAVALPMLGMGVLDDYNTLMKRGYVGDFREEGHFSC